MSPIHEAAMRGAVKGMQELLAAGMEREEAFARASSGLSLMLQQLNASDEDIAEAQERLEGEV